MTITELRKELESFEAKGQGNYEVFVPGVYISRPYPLKEFVFGAELVDCSFVAIDDPTSTGLSPAVLLTAGT